MPRLALFAGAAAQDGPAPGWAHDLKAASANPASQVTIADGKAHGTDIFADNPGYASGIAAWLAIASSRAPPDADARRHPGYAGVRMRHTTRRFGAGLAAGAATVLAVGFGLGVIGAGQASPPAPRDWPAYGGGPSEHPLLAARPDQPREREAARRSPGPTIRRGPGGLQAQPIVVDGVSTRRRRSINVVALDAATGAVRWTFDSGIDGPRPEPRRDLLGRAATTARIFAAVDQYVYALDAATGKPIPGFGAAAASTCARTWAATRRSSPSASPRRASSTRTCSSSAAATSEGLPASPGDIRAYDVRTGDAALGVPHDSASGRAGLRDLAEGRVDSTAAAPTTGRAWPLDDGARHRLRAHRIGGAPISTARIAPATTSSPTPCSRWTPTPASASGTSRPCTTTSGIATSRRRPPGHGARATARRVDAVAQTTKHGYVFVFDRANGHAAVPDRGARVSRERRRRARSRRRRSRFRRGPRRSRGSSSPRTC